MKKTTSQSIFIAAALFFTTHAAFAHDQTGALGKAAGATDYYAISCFDDGNGAAAYLVFQIMDALPVAAPVVSAQVTTKGRLAVNTTDAIDGDATYSPKVLVKGGNGTYYVSVDKTKAGVENYSFQYHCETSDNQHTGTSIIPLQSQ